MDVSLALDWLVPAAVYRGVLTDNTAAAFDSLEWLDGRAKPSWADLVLAYSQASGVAAANDAQGRRDMLLREAATRIAPLQDAVDLGIATEHEAEQLHLWKLYRVQLSRIEQQEGFPLAVDWPSTPAE